MHQILTVMEKAELINQMVKDFDDDPEILSPRKGVANVFDLSISRIREYEKIASLPEELKEQVRREPQCSARQLLSIARICDPDKQKRAFFQYLNEVLSEMAYDESGALKEDKVVSRENQSGELNFAGGHQKEDLLKKLWEFMKHGGDQFSEIDLLRLLEELLQYKIVLENIEFNVCKHLRSRLSQAA